MQVDGNGALHKALPKLNTLLLVEVITWAYYEHQAALKGEPSEWQQSTWFIQNTCGTACCAFGKAVELTPSLEIFKHELRSRHTVRGEVTDGYGERKEFTGLSYASSAFYTAGKAAFGLTEGEASLLSNGANTIGDLIHYGISIAQSRGEKVPELHELQEKLYSAA
jgi:hypothetical protein